MRFGVAAGLLALVAPLPGGEGSYSARAFGARGDGAAKDTAAVQAAIDAAARAGGGRVLLPAGRYLSGTLHLKSDIRLDLAPGAVLIASPDEADFDRDEALPTPSADDRETTFFHHSLLAGEGLERVAITGEGTIDGNRPKRGGPKPVALKNCAGVTLRGITIRNSPNYAVSLLGCSHVAVKFVYRLN